MKYLDEKNDKVKKFKLPKKIKAKWLKALRSGDYKQGTGQLKFKSSFMTTAEFCCLGVACDAGIAKPECGNLNLDGYVNKSFMPEEIQKKLADYNDGGKSFNWIASFIERYL